MPGAAILTLNAGSSSIKLGLFDAAARFVDRLPGASPSSQRA